MACALDKVKGRLDISPLLDFKNLISSARLDGDFNTDERGSDDDTKGALEKAAPGDSRSPEEDGEVKHLRDSFGKT